MNDLPIEVWGLGTPRTLRVYWALEELGIPYVQHIVRTRTSDMDSAEFLAVSPGKKIPVISHGELRLTESAAIVDYLFRLATAAPSDPALIARVEQWTSFALMELDATALYVLRRHRGLAQIYGEAPTAVAAAEAYFQRQAAVVAGALDDDRTFLVGECLSKADIVLLSCCEWARLEQLVLPPALENYRARLTARPAFQQALKLNTPPA